MVSHDQEETAGAQIREAGEIRQDIVTGKWVIVARERADRPHDYRLKPERPVPGKRVKYEEGCPFCQLERFPQEPDVLRLPDHPDRWQLHVFPNKYPAFLPKDDFRTWRQGPYRAIESAGYHEILATRWHHKIDVVLSRQELALQLEALVLRFRQLKSKPSVNYIQIIKNHGEQSGASLAHPHHQLLTVPVLPSDVCDMLAGAERYARQHQREVFQTVADYELREGSRVVAQNEHFMSFCPYASRVPFEVWVMPKSPEPYFENCGPEMREAAAEVLVDALARIYQGLNDPSYNYYIHTAPCDEAGFTCGTKEFSHFRWHIEILPRLNVWGGFELGTGLEVTDTPPEEAAAFLREVKIDRRSG